MKKLFILFSFTLMLAGCGGDSEQAVNIQNADLPADIAETSVGTFACQTNADCGSDEWCYATAELAACTKK